MAIEELVSRIHYISDIFNLVRKAGIHLDVSTDFDALRQVNKTQIPGVNVATSFDNRKLDLDGENAFWIRGRDDSGQIVHTQSVKLINLQDELLETYLRREVGLFPPPGTTIARTPSATLLPRATSAAARRSSIRLFVHEPMKTRCTGVPLIGVPPSSPI